MSHLLTEKETPMSEIERGVTVPIKKRTIEEEEVEEREWDSIVSKPHVRQALRRMADEARRQYYAGETEEGGFGLE
jgi:hypothetical protein